MSIGPTVRTFAAAAAFAWAANDRVQALEAELVKRQQQSGDLLHHVLSHRNTTGLQRAASFPHGSSSGCGRRRRGASAAC